MNTGQKLGVRWTLGDVGERGFEALRLSIWGAWRLFGPDAAYAVCVNSIPPERARALTGELPRGIVWHDTTAEIPGFLNAFFDSGMAEGVGWKLAPLRFFPDRYELSLDNDCILWDMPETLRQWLDDDQDRTCLMAEDVAACFGQFAGLCGPEPRNAGIRGLPPQFDLERALRDVLQAQESACQQPLLMTSELDEQGLQTAALSWDSAPLAVSLDDVAICSPFYPHRPDLGRCGAHFVGLNARHIAWDYYDRPADECMTEHWQRHRADLYAHVGLAQRKRTTREPATNQRTASQQAALSEFLSGRL